MRRTTLTVELTGYEKESLILLRYRVLTATFPYYFCFCAYLLFSVMSIHRIHT